MENKIISSNSIESLLEVKNLYKNPSIELISEHIVQNGEGHVGMNGALMVDTGIFTGRSPEDKYFVEEDSSKNNLWWGPVNRKIDVSVFDNLFNKII